jgi:hypothetical protein
MSNELNLIAVIAKSLSDLQTRFRTLAKQQGPEGPQGPQGPQGLPGADGRDGIDGKDGADGRDGIDGKDGADGRDGIDGKDGGKGEKGDPPEHKWDGSKLSFRHPDGTWGKKVDLRGPGRVVVAGSYPADGPTAAVVYPGKMLVWGQGRLNEVLLYLDSAKTQLAERRVLNYTGAALTSIDFFDGDGTQTKTRTLAYSAGVLSSVTEA